MIRGAPYELDAKTAFLNYLVTNGLLVYDNKVLGGYSVEEIASETWNGRANYVTIDKQKPAAGDWYCSIDTTGGTQHITHSRKTTAYAPSGGTAPKTNGLIGNNGESVEGVEWPLPVCSPSRATSPRGA